MSFLAIKGKGILMNFECNGVILLFNIFYILLFNIVFGSTVSKIFQDFLTKA